jgi:hypothetical protein
MPLDASAIADAFGLGRLLDAPRPLANGSHPSVTRVLVTERGRWVVKTDELLGDWWLRRTERVHRLESAALAAGIPMARPVPPPEPALGYWYRTGNGPELVRVSAWVEGHDLRGPKDGGLVDTARWAGDTLGRIALLGLPGDADGEDEDPVHSLAEWREWVDEAVTADHPVAVPARTLLPVIEDATALVTDALRDAPPSALVHGDTSQANILRTPTGYALIDWDATRADVPWWEAVNVAFQFTGSDNGPSAEADPEVVRAVLGGYAGRGAPVGPADVSSFAGMLRGQLHVTAWALWLALGHRGDDPERRAFGLRIITEAAREMPRVLRSLDSWTTLLRWPGRAYSGLLYAAAPHV